MNCISEIYDILNENYGPQGWWPIEGEYSGKKSLTKADRFEICIGAILTQSTSWKNVEKALDSLRDNDSLKKEAMKRLSNDKLALLIKSAGYHNQKTRKLKEFVKHDEPFDRNKLLSIWGIGKETADSIMLYTYQEPIFVIDAYTKRIMSRLGFCDEDVGYDELQKMFMEKLPYDSSLFNEYHALLVEHAKRHCKKTPVCKQCPLSSMCRYNCAK